MADILTQVWYDSTKSAQENYELAEEWYANNKDMTTMTDAESTEMVELYGKLRIMIKQEQDKVKAFNDAMNADSLAVEEQVASLRSAWQQKWANTDGSYTIPQ